MFVFQIALGGLDQVRNQVVPAFELHIDLGEGVLEAVPQGDEPVVDADHDEGQHDDEGEEEQEGGEEDAHGLGVDAGVELSRMI